MTKNLASLIEDAKDAGYEVVRKGEETTIYKLVKVNGSASRSFGIWINDGNTAIQLDTDLSCAKCIRSYKDMRSILGI